MERSHDNRATDVSDRATDQCQGKVRTNFFLERSDGHPCRLRDQTPGLRTVRKWISYCKPPSCGPLYQQPQETSACTNTDETPVWSVKGTKKPEDHILLIPFTGRSGGARRMSTKGHSLSAVRNRLDLSDWDGGSWDSRSKSQLYLKKGNRRGPMPQDFPLYISLLQNFLSGRRLLLA